MAQSFLIFDFGSDESAAQQARHKIEGWKQAFRLGSKILLKFERAEAAGSESASGDGGEPKSSAKKKSPAKKEESVSSGHIRLLVRLDFSDHEKLSHHRWLDRIPADDAFKSSQSETVRHSDPAFSKTSDLFDSLP